MNAPGKGCSPPKSRRREGERYVTVWPMVAEGPSAALRRASHSPTLGRPAGADETLAFTALVDWPCCIHMFAHEDAYSLFSRHPA